MDTMNDERNVREESVVTKLNSLLECPICYNVPRDLPIPQCPAGHIICIACRALVTSCPTCRRQMSDGTSSLAASMIDLVPHKCKFYEYGCEVKDLLIQLKKHEKRCDERTVICPNNKCRAEVQLKMFEEHAQDNDCWVKLDGQKYFISTVSKGFLQWDGTSKNRGEEFDFGRGKTKWMFNEINGGGSIFILRKYIANSRLFVFAVMMAGSQEEVRQYSANLTIYNESLDLEVNYKCPIISIEHCPPEEDLISHDKCWNVHYSTMRKFFYFVDKGDDNNHDWVVKYRWKIEIVQKEV